MAVVQILGVIVGIAAAGGWFAKAEWADEILGEFPGDKGEPEGGILDDLEALTGRNYPQLHKMRREAREAFTEFRWALPWNKGSTAETYQKKVQQFSKAVQAEAEAYQREAAPLATLGTAVTSPDWWKKYLPWMGVGVTIVGLIFILTRKKGEKK